jgi:hypothetical protein
VGRHDLRWLQRTGKAATTNGLRQDEERSPERAVQAAIPEDERATRQTDQTTVKEYLDKWIEDIWPNVSYTTLSQYGGFVRNHIGPHLAQAAITSKRKPNVVQERFGRSGISLMKDT